MHWNGSSDKPMRSYCGEWHRSNDFRFFDFRFVSADCLFCLLADLLSGVEETLRRTKALATEFLRRSSKLYFLWLVGLALLDSHNFYGAMVLVQRTCD